MFLYCQYSSKSSKKTSNQSISSPVILWMSLSGFFLFQLYYLPSSIQFYRSNSSKTFWVEYFGPMELKQDKFYQCSQIDQINKHINYNVIYGIAMGACNLQSIDQNQFSNQEVYKLEIKKYKIIKECYHLPVPEKIIQVLQFYQPYFKINPPLLYKVYSIEKGGYYQGGIKVHLGLKVFEGPGRLLLGNKMLIQSDFRQGQPENYTRIFKENGAHYIGEFNPETAIFDGILQQDGIKYEGKLLHSRPHGAGKEETTTYYYQGQYNHGCKVKGKLTWNLSEPKHLYSYTGSFEENQFSGEGILINEQGKYQGMFKRGKKHGIGQQQTVDGKKIKGKFEYGVFIHEQLSTKEENQGNQNGKQQYNDERIELKKTFRPIL